jgi:light-regulated signal transduction histidine kinase (bacteriophytochrome)
MGSSLSYASLIQKPVLLQTYPWSLREPTINKKNQSIYDAALNRAKMADQLSQQLEQQKQQAKAANLQRYNDILAGFGNLENTVNTEFQNAGTQGEKDIQNNLALDQAKNTQSLVNAGMNGTTIAPSLNMAASNNANDALARLREQLRLQKLGYITDLTNNKLAFMERRTDEYPDMSTYMPLINALGNTTPQYV